MVTLLHIVIPWLFVALLIILVRRLLPAAYESPPATLTPDQEAHRLWSIQVGQELVDNLNHRVLSEAEAKDPDGL